MKKTTGSIEKMVVRVLGLLALAQAGITTCNASAPVEIFVANGVDPYVTRIDASTQQISGTVGLPGIPFSLVSNGQGHMFVGVLNNGIIDIDANNNYSTSSITAAGNLSMGLALNGIGGTALFLTDQSFEVRIVDTETKTLLGTAGSGISEYLGLAWDGATGMYVGGVFGNFVERIGIPTLSLGDPIVTTHFPHLLAWDGATGIYVFANDNSGKAKLDVIDLETQSLSNTLETSFESGNAGGLAWDGATGMWLGFLPGDVIEVFDTQTLQSNGTAALSAFNPHSIAWDRGEYMYVLGAAFDNVSIVDRRTLQEVAVLPLGFSLQSTPYAVAVNFSQGPIPSFSPIAQLPVLVELLNGELPANTHMQLSPDGQPVSVFAGKPLVDLGTSGVVTFFSANGGSVSIDLGQGTIESSVGSTAKVDVLPQSMNTTVQLDLNLQPTAS